MSNDVAALFVDKKGPYFDMPGVDPWDVERDATKYAGPHPVVAHPPCARWGKFWFGSTGPHYHGGRKERGDDGGLFEFALRTVRRWGGVIEHPAGSSAFRAFGIPTPTRGAGWQRTMDGEWICQLAQSAYGHRAQKLTILLLCGGEPIATNWSSPATTMPVERMGRTERRLTPQPFADFLVALARGARRRRDE